MLKNGKASSGKQSRHVDIRYFFIKDRVDEGEFSVKCFPTENMIAGFFRKPLQGGLLRKLPAVVMGEVDMGTFMNSKTPWNQRRV